MMMLVVVPGEELLAETARILNRAEAVRVFGSVFHGFEVRFGKGVVVGDVRPAMGLDDTKVGQQQSKGLRRHRRTTVGMELELTRKDTLLFTGMLDQLFGQTGGLAISDHPAGDVAAKHVQNDVEIIEAPFHRPPEFGDVPAPELVRSGGQQFRLAVRRMDELVAALAVFTGSVEQPIHGSDRAMILARVEQRSIDLGGGTILKPLLMQTGQNGG